MRHTIARACIVLPLFCAAEAGAVPNPFKRYQPEVVIADPYVEMRTGPGRGYPIFHVAREGDRVVLLKRRTDYFKIRVPRGSHAMREGWIHREDVRRTLAVDGSPIEFGKISLDDFSERRWEIGLGGGDVDGASTISGSVGFNLNPYIGFQIEGSQILGEYSDGYLVSAGILAHPFPRWRISPFFTIGTGLVHIEPQTTIVQAEDLDDEIVHAGIGADVYITNKFSMRLEYRRNTVLTSRDKNEELNQWKAAFSVFF